MRPLFLTFGLLLAGLHLLTSAPAAAQPSASPCRLEATPPLPAGANQTSPAARPGFVWIAGAYQCRRGSWNYIPPHWERRSAGYVPSAMTMIDVRRGRIHARPGYEIVQQGSGPSSQTLLRQIGRGPRGNALSLVTVELGCSCVTASGNCEIRTRGNIAYCTHGEPGCTGRCSMTTTTLSAGAGPIAQRREIIGTTDCAPSGTGLTARR